MIRNYRAIQQWERWLTQFLGASVLEVEKNFTSRQLAERYGKHALLIGVPEQQVLLSSSAICNHVILSPLHTKNKFSKYIESGFYELPIIPGTIDLVILPHTLEIVDNPRQLLTEACRLVKPEGDIMIFGFNPVSLWGVKKWWVKNKNTPWSGNFISPARIRHWLELADFELVRQDALLYRPPIQRHQLYKKLKFLEWLGGKLHTLGGVYVITAKAKSIPLTPIKLHWQQTLSTLSVTMQAPR